MTIDKAIRHSEEVAKRYERMEDSHDDKLREECLQCAADHRQLAEWLTELKELKVAGVQPIDRWISVKDRLPEDDGKYMVWYKGELDICEFDVESQTFGYTYDDYDEMYSHLVCWDDGMDKDITHWMPLPEPPKDGDTECHDTK